MTAFDLIDETFCTRLTTTLAHFLWQGAVLGLASLVAGHRMRRMSPSRRYGVDLAILGAMAACPVVTFFLIGPPHVATAFVDVARGVSSTIGSPPPEPSPVGATERTTAAGAVQPSPRAAIGLADPSRRTTRGFARPAALAYFLGVLLLLARTAAGQYGTFRLRRSARPVSDPHLLALAERLRRRLRLAALPPLLESTRVVVPAVIGAIRPAVLLPVAFAAGLDVRHVEAVLLHELAHVRRYDPLVNLLQRLAEMFLFFHPAVWFVSRRLRAARERCCDDLVVACGVGPADYAASLLEFAAADFARGPFSPAVLHVARPGSELGRRVRRLLGEPEQAEACVSWEGLTMTLLLSAAVAFGLAGYDPPDAAAEETVRARPEEEGARPVYKAEEGAKVAWTPLRTRTLTPSRPYLNLVTGELFPSTPDTDDTAEPLQERAHADVELTSLDGKSAIAFHGVYAVETESVRWEAGTAAEARQAYADGGFAIVPFERESIYPVVAEELPMTIMIAELGLLRVTEMAAGERPAVAVEYKLYPPRKPVKPADEAAALSEAERRLVGRWIGGPLRPQLLTLRADRTFEQLLYEPGGLPPVAATYAGTWKVEGGALIRSFGRLPGGEDTLTCDRVQISRPEGDELLRLSVVHDDGVTGSSGTYLRMKDEEPAPDLGVEIDEKTSQKASQLVGTWQRASFLAVWFETLFPDGTYLYTSNLGEVRLGRWKVVEGDLILNWRPTSPGDEPPDLRAGQERRLIVSIDAERVAFAFPDDPEAGLVPGGVAVKSYKRVRARPTE